MFVYVIVVFCLSYFASSRGVSSHHSCNRASPSPKRGSEKGDPTIKSHKHTFRSLLGHLRVTFFPDLPFRIPPWGHSECLRAWRAAFRAMESLDLNRDPNLNRHPTSHMAAFHAQFLDPRTRVLSSQMFYNVSNVLAQTGLAKSSLYT